MKFAKVKTVSSPEDVLVPITSEDKPQISEESQHKWQKILDLAAKLIGVPSGLITRLSERHLEVFLSSATEGNIFTAGEKFELGLGWYCENVAGNRDRLVLPDALKSESWKDNPSVPFNIVSYMGVPILWPDGEVFGTFCMLDNGENRYTDLQRELLESLREIIQNDLKMSLLYQQARECIEGKDLQLREVHHSIKNHFNLLISTLALQSHMDLDDAGLDSVLRDIHSRIAAISLIHDRLYRTSDIDHISLKSYISDLAGYIVKTFRKGTIALSCTGGDFSVRSRVSVPCGLIVNELLTNSLKYAFADVAEPAIDISIERKGDEITLHYRDNGPGLPDGYDPSRARTLGILIINRLAAQLKGKHSIGDGNGFSFTLRFTPPGGVSTVFNDGRLRPPADSG